MTRTIPGTRRLGTALLMVALSAAPALAQTQGGQGHGRLTPAQKQKIFPGLRTLQLQSTKARIAILQKSEQCVEAASSLDTLGACLQQERQATMAQRQQNRDAVKKLYESNGVTMPQPGNKSGKGN